MHPPANSIEGTIIVLVQWLKLGIETAKTKQQTKGRSMKTTRINIETRSRNKRKQNTEQGKSMKSFAKKWLAGLVSVVGVVMLMTSCATTGGNWSPDFPEKGSAKGGASQLMKR